MAEKAKTYKIACGVLNESWDQNKMALLEVFKLLFLKMQNRVLGVLNVAQSGFLVVLIDPKVVFPAALKACASGII
ncbi:JAB domain-containing protein [Pedobacter agri]|uniref:JAB domain-containing protein n=1 Tax=Pedobacter agri TaxID=454586 RepID=UPI002930C6CA|nr:JAB domain-containing protein [Pedobacter agri]